MLLEFTKMNGAGNDFIFIDNRAGKIALSREQVARLCDRHRGIGADGLMLFVPCPDGRADWAWDFFNSDGGPAEMCGNGARCFARYIQRLTGVKTKVTFLTGAGVIAAQFHGERVTVSLTEPHDLRLNQIISLAAGKATVHSVNTGVPHAAIFVPDADKAHVSEVGPEIRQHPHFGAPGTNVNFIQVVSPGSIRVRTFERGVGETLACGTGVAASALIANAVHGFPSPVRVRVLGGDELEVAFDGKDGQFSNVRLTGPAEFVFDGRIEL